MSRKSFFYLVIIISVFFVCLPATSGQSSIPSDTRTNQLINDEVLAVGKSQPAKPPASLNSPKATILTFLDAINRSTQGNLEAWLEVYQCLDLSDIDRQRARTIALELWGVLNRLEYIDHATPLPDAEFAAQNQLVRYMYFPNDRFNPAVQRQAKSNSQITLIKLDSGVWKFSAQTGQGIHDLYIRVAALKTVGQLHDERSSSVSLWLRSKMPQYLTGARFLNLEYWQWLGLALFVLLGVTLDQCVRFVLRLFALHGLNKRHAQANRETIDLAVRPLGLLAASLLWIVLLPALNLPGPALLVLLTAVRMFTSLAGTWAAWCATNLISEILAKQAAKTTTKIDDVLIPLLRKTIKVLIVVFGMVYAAAALNIPVMPMVTSLGIGGLAFAFAAKDTIENFFGSVAVILDRPFEVGDWVVIGDVEGTVEEVGFRSTRIRTFYNSQVTVPNATLVRATVDNYGRRRYRRVKTHVGIQYDTPPEKIVAFTEGIRELVRTHPFTRKDYFQVWLHQFGASSLDILIYVFHETVDWATELRERERLFLDIVRLADQLQVQFAFPTQTVHLYQSDTDAAPQPSAPPSGESQINATEFGIRTAQALVKNQPWMHIKPPPVQFLGGPTIIDDDSKSQLENRSAGG